MESKKMNIEELEAHFIQVGANTIKPKFHLVIEAVNSTVSASGILEEKVDYTTLELLKVINFVEAFIVSEGLEYEYPKNDGGEIDFIQTYDELIKVYELIQFNDVLVKMEELLEREVQLAEKRYLQMGMMESKLIEIMDKGINRLGEVVELVKDKEKIEGLVGMLKDISSSQTTTKEE